MLLNCVVSEMDLEIAVIVFADRVSHRRCTDVALLEKVNSQVLSQQHPDPDIELSPLKQEGSFHILLDNEGVRLNNESTP